MKNSKIQAVIIILCGSVCIGAACFVYCTGHTVYANSDSPRVQDLNRMLNIFGKTGTTILFALPGFIAVYAGVYKLRKKK